MKANTTIYGSSRADEGGYGRFPPIQVAGKPAPAVAIEDCDHVTAP